MAESFWDMSLDALFPPVYRGKVFSPDDLVDSLTRCASLADSAAYGLRRGRSIDVVARFEQIKEEALDAIARLERGEVS